MLLLVWTREARRRREEVPLLAWTQRRRSTEEVLLLAWKQGSRRREEGLHRV